MLYLVRIENHMQGVVVVKIVEASSETSIKDSLKEFETLLSCEKATSVSRKILNENREYVVSVYDAKLA